MAINASYLPDDTSYKKHLIARQSAGYRWQLFFLGATLIGLVMLVVLLLSILNQSFGLIAVREKVSTESITNGRSLDSMSVTELGDVLKANLSKGKLQAAFLQFVAGSDVDRNKLGKAKLSEVIPNKVIAQGLGDKKFSELTPDDLTKLITDNASTADLAAYIKAQIIGREVLQSWSFIESVTNRAAIEQLVKDRAAGTGFAETLTQKQIDEQKAAYASAHLEFHSWLSGEFIASPNSTTPSDAGIRGGLIGTLWVITLTMLIATPLGVGAAIYLEEYAKDAAFARSPWIVRANQIIETNIRNLAGVPSIIYGLLGLVLFARVLFPLTSGEIFGIQDGRGNTILSASLTLALLILPVIIINAQEAIRAVPRSIREGSYGMGATKWQTVWRQVLPAAIPGIMTGVILSLSRAVGETAPLVVVGAAVFLSKDPNGPFQPFTTLPIQIFNWTEQPSDQFRAAAAAGIVVLLVLLLVLNASAIILRQRFSRRLQG
jgi:phosphate transport system permease protein